MSADHLKRYALLSSLAEHDREALEPLLEAIELEAGEPLFQEGHESEGLVLVASGALRLDSARAERRAGTIQAGGTVGALSLIALGARGVTAVASEPTRVLLLSRSAFRRLVDDAPRAGCRVLEAVLAETASQLRASLDVFAPSE